MNIRDFIDEQAPDQEVLIADGLDAAFIGLTKNENYQSIAVYDKNKIIEILMVRDGMEYVEALEYFEFNIEQAYVGEQTPIYITGIPDTWNLMKDANEARKLLQQLRDLWVTFRDFGSCCPTKDPSNAPLAEKILEKVNAYLTDIAHE